MTEAERAAMAAAGMPLGDVETVADLRHSSTLRGIGGALGALRTLRREWAALPRPLRERMERVVHLDPDGTVAVYRLDRDP